MPGLPRFSAIVGLVVLAACTSGEHNVVAPLPPAVDARVILSNAAGAERGLWLSDYSGTPGLRAYVSTGDTILVGTRQGASTIVAFNGLRPVTMLDIPKWLPDDFVRLADPILLPVTIWVLKGPYAAQRQLEITAVATTTAILNAERTGLGIGTLTINDATANSHAAEFSQFSCTQAQTIQSEIGATPDQINIYVVDLVQRDSGGFGPGNGYSCGGGVIALGWAGSPDLMMHEIGHAFGLTHIDDLTGDFDRTNVMHSSSITRQFLTEGQVFRAILGDDSDINARYHARPGQSTRNCGREVTSAVRCPAIQLRLWPDGSVFPANY